MYPSQETREANMISLVYGGDAIGRLDDGRTIFVPYTLPGEKVKARIIEEKKGYVRASLVELLKPSPQRITPRCPHFSDCGGCHYQHLPYDLQLVIKHQILGEQLQRIANITNFPIDAMIPSPLQWNYRNAVQFHLAADGRLGFRGADSHRIVSIRECHLPEDALNDAWPRLEYEQDAGLQRIELRQGCGEDLLLILEGKEYQEPVFQTDLRLSAVYVSGGETRLLAGEDFIWMDILGRIFRVSAGSFFQVNSRQAERMVAHLLSILPLSPASIVLDLYCGVGLFSAFLAPIVKRCIGIEISPSASEDYVANLDEFDNVELYIGAVESVLPELNIKADVVVMDPPRSGSGKIALDEIMKIRPDVIAYISCDPATLARDCRHLLAGGYQLERVTPFDMFPQTYHIESINIFRLSN
jgi:23S rRNA (uracil1939-C5)-methyltransferase